MTVIRMNDLESLLAVSETTSFRSADKEGAHSANEELKCGAIHAPHSKTKDFSGGKSDSAVSLSSLTSDYRSRRTSPMHDQLTEFDWEPQKPTA